MLINSHSSRSIRPQHHTKPASGPAIHHFLAPLFWKLTALIIGQFDIFTINFHNLAIFTITQASEPTDQSKQPTRSCIIDVQLLSCAVTQNAQKSRNENNSSPTMATSCWLEEFGVKPETGGSYRFMLSYFRRQYIKEWYNDHIMSQ